MMMRFPKRSVRLQALLDAMERLAPLQHADTTWDNVGLILESEHEGRTGPYKVLLTVDLTEPVAMEAAQYDAVIAYHPPWFRGAKSLTLDTGKEARSIAYLASRGVSVYSPHTALDNVRPGINDWVLGELFPGLPCRPVIPSAVDETMGAGRILILNRPIKLGDALQMVSRKFGLPAMRYSLGLDHSLDTEIRIIAVCVGSGASVFAKIKGPVDLLLTGEMSHHEMLKAAADLNASVILTEHSTMERAFLFGPFRQRLAEILSADYQISTSTIDRDPVIFHVNQ